ncbi:hypothetical protein PFISCL1PPCAC_20889, partial [Pristionchus fissidentatus]
NFRGIYALTSQGEHLYHEFSGPDNKTVTTTVISTGMVDQCSYVSWGIMIVAAYGVNTIHISEHRNFEKTIKPRRSITTLSPIRQCFVNFNACVVCTDTRIAVVHAKDDVSNNSAVGFVFN